MAIDPSIALGFRPPEQPSQINMLAQALQLQGLQRQNQMGALDMKDREAAAAERNALRNYLAGGADLNTPEGQAGALRVAPNAASPMIKGNLEIGKLRGEIGKTAAQTDEAKAKTIGEQFKNRQALITQNLQVLGSVSSPEQAAQWIQGGVQSGLIDGSGAQNSMAELQAALKAGPQGFAQWKQQQMQAGMTIAQQMEQQWKAQEFGLNKDKFAYQQKNDAANRGVTIRGQNMADSRARDLNQTQRELLTQEKTLKVAELQDKADAKAQAKDAAVSSIENQVAAIDMALNHPGRATGTGLSSIADPRNYIPGTDATNFGAVVEQIKGAAFLQAFQSLKGGGAITEIEGKKAEGAIARLKTTQSDVEFEKSLKELRGIMRDGYRRLSGRDLPEKVTPRGGGGASGDWGGGPQIKFLGFEGQ